jgi:hypothetical protein
VFTLTFGFAPIELEFYIISESVAIFLNPAVIIVASVAIEFLAPTASYEL